MGYRDLWQQDHGPMEEVNEFMTDEGEFRGIAGAERLQSHVAEGRPAFV